VSRYRTELIWPPFKGKAHKVVDASTGQGIGLYRTAEGARRKAKAMNEASVDNPALEALRRNVSGRIASGEAEAITEVPVKLASLDDPAMTCTRCGQASITRQTPNVCETCKAVERRKQGETVRLFEPAPTQMPGQMSF
jgi:hypothetical protein